MPICILTAWTHPVRRSPCSLSLLALSPRSPYSLSLLAASLPSLESTPDNPSRADSESSRVDLEWRLEPWLCSLQENKGGGFVAAIAEALLRPLREETKFETTEVDGALELSFLRTLGETDSSDAIYKVLSDGDVLYELSNTIYAAAQGLVLSSADGDAMGTSSKFFEDSDSSIRYGALDTFYQGLGKSQ